MRKLLFIPILILLLHSNKANSQCYGAPVTPIYSAIEVSSYPYPYNQRIIELTSGSELGDCIDFQNVLIPNWISVTCAPSDNGGYLLSLIFSENETSIDREFWIPYVGGSIHIIQKGAICKSYIETPFFEFEATADQTKSTNLLSTKSCGIPTFIDVPSWLTITTEILNLPNTSVKGGVKVILNAQANTSNLLRSAVIKYSDGEGVKSFVVCQKAATPNNCTVNVATDFMQFENSGGTQNAVAEFMGVGQCLTNESFVFLNVPSWLTVSQTPNATGAIINVSCQSGNYYPRYAEIICILPSKNIVKRITVHQKSNNTDPPPCPNTVVFNNYNYPLEFDYSGGTLSGNQVSYGDDYTTCAGFMVLTNVPSWISTGNQISSLPVTQNIDIVFAPNQSAAPLGVTPERQATIYYHIPNSEVSGSFIVKQGGCSRDWYVDSDGDGAGDFGTPVVVTASCNQPYEGLADNDFDYCPNIPNDCPGGDGDTNWTSEDLFDVTGAPLSSSKTHFDDLGKPTESLSKDFMYNKVWGSEIVYDSFGRKYKESFPAISTYNNLNPTKLLTSNSAQLYRHYSKDNSPNPFQATATQPYSEMEYDKLNPGNVIRQFGGNQADNLKTTPVSLEWKTGYTFTVPAAQEMYYLFGYNFFTGELITSPTPAREKIQTKFYKTVGIDANGVENVVFTDGEGKTLASARSGASNISPYKVFSLIGTQGYVDVHIPSGTPDANFTPGTLATNYVIYDLKTGALISPTPTALVSGNAYRIALAASVPIPTTDPIVYVTNATSGGVLSTSAGAYGIYYMVNYYDYAINVYDKTNRLSRSIQPNGFKANFPALNAPFKILSAPTYLTSPNFATVYTYDTLGQVTQVVNKDEGTSKFVYRKDGQIRYSQSQLQTNTKVSYTDYDTYGRPIESGVITTATGIWAIASANADTAALIGLNTQRSEQTFTIYDYPENTTSFNPVVALPTNLTLSAVLNIMGLTPALIATNYLQKNLSGNVAITFTKPTVADPNPTAISWYSYDLYGRLEWIVQYNKDIGAKTIHYQYDQKGNVEKVLYQKDKPTPNNELFVHRYTYNLKGALTKVETSVDNTVFMNHAEYNYNVSGELQRLHLVQAEQRLDYVYTLGGMLKSINPKGLFNQNGDNDPEEDYNDVFSLRLDYYKGDYTNTNVPMLSSPNVSGSNQDFNGNIKAAVWTSRPLDESDPSQPGHPENSFTPQAYLYNYNRDNWLTGATYGTVQNGSTITTPEIPIYTEGNLTYDANGNILSLRRSNASGIVEDELSYRYATTGTNAGTNRLINVDDNVLTTANPTDIEDQASGNYVYDLIGRMTRNVNENLNYYYNTQGLTTEVRRGSLATNPIVKFFYNERGQRIRKESYNTGVGSSTLMGTTYYILDLSGNLMSSYYKASGTNTPITQNELPIYGASRLGMYQKQNPAKDFANYEITDHLGNVRVVVKKVFQALPPLQDNGDGTYSWYTDTYEGANSVSSYADYYPFGEQLPSRSIVSSPPYKYAFQGQELDTELGMEAFQLRLWDGRIGRWLSPDPYGQHFSPYAGMGNNPISRVDPDGGYETWFGAFFSWIGGGFKGSVISNPAGENNTDPSRNYGIKYRDGYLGVTPKFNPNDKVHQLGEVGIPHIRYRDKTSGGSSTLFAEAFLHYQIGFGTPFDINTSDLDMSPISMKTPEIQNIVRDGSGSINLFSYSKNQTALVIGSVGLKYLGNNKFSLKQDTYDFDIRWKQGFTKRNIATFGAGLLHGPVIDNVPIALSPSLFFGGTYKINFHGTVTLKH